MTTSQSRTERRHQDQNRRKAVKKFQGGNITPNEFYRKHGFPPGAKCRCGAPPAVKATVLVEYKEALRRGMVPPVAVDGAVNEAVAKTIVNLRGPSGPVPHFRTSATYACANCRVTMEKALAKGPSWAVVEINEGPDPRNRVTVGYHS